VSRWSPIGALRSSEGDGRYRRVVIAREAVFPCAERLPKIVLPQGIGFKRFSATYYSVEAGTPASRLRTPESVRGAEASTCHAASLKRSTAC